MSDFSLEQTLFCGQCFRFKVREDGGFEGVILDKNIILYQTDDGIEVEGCEQDNIEKYIVDYFSLDTDYDNIKNILRKDAVLSNAISYASGIRVMRQPLWETVCSFIISQNNNIKRISGIIDRLCTSFGNDVSGFYSFPTPQKLSGLTVEDLAPLKSGFRAKYIIDAAKKFSDGSIDQHLIKTAPLEVARNSLMTINGIGPKVADCSLLFGANRLEAFPTDVWIKRAMEQLFPDGLPDFALPYAGIAQQYIFHYARTSDVLK